jgi:hypothetical protein
MQEEQKSIGIFIKSKLSNLIAYLQETLASEDPHLLKGFESMKADLEAAAAETVVGMTFMGVKYIAPHGYLPPDNEQSVAWLKKLMTTINIALVSKIPDKEKLASVQSIFDKLEDTHLERFILYINCFSEVLQPEAFAAGVKLHEQ